MLRRSRREEPSLRLYYASDIHGSDVLWRKFLNAAAFYEVEILIMGVRGKELVWTSLERIGATTDPPLAELQARARDQIAGLEELHARAVALELGPA